MQFLVLIVAAVHCNMGMPHEPTNRTTMAESEEEFIPQKIFIYHGSATNSTSLFCKKTHVIQKGFCQFLLTVKVKRWNELMERVSFY